jgi:hypothetical protein
VPFLTGEIAAAEQAASATRGRARAAEEAIAAAQATIQSLRAQLAGQQADVGRLVAERDAVAAQVAGVAALLQQAQVELNAARSAHGQAQQALDLHLADEPQPPEGVGGRPPRPAEIAAWRRAHAQWEAAIPGLRQAVAAAEAAVAAADARVAQVAGQNADLTAQLADAQTRLNAAQAAVTATLMQIAAQEASLPALFQARDAAHAALAPLQAEIDALTGLAAAVERDPFDRAELEQAAAELGARLRGLQAERATAAAEEARRAAEGRSLRSQEAAARARLAELDASLPGLQAAASAASSDAIAAEAAVQAAETAVANATEAIRRHKRNRPKRRPFNAKLPDQDPFDEGAIEAWQAALEGLADAQAQAVERLVAARAARDAAIARRDAASTAVVDAQAARGDAERLLSALTVGALAAEQAAAAARGIVAALDPRIAELREARETATARLLGDVGTDRRLVLAPVRLETRFVGEGAGRALLVRIYPDDWFVHTHEAALTVDEEEWGRHYHEQIAGAGEDVERRAWDQLAERFGPQRAAWIAAVLDPAQPRRVGERTASWTRAPQTALLPDRWVAIGRGRDGRHAFCAWSRPVAADPLPVGLAPAEDPLAGQDARWLTEFDAAIEAGMALRVPLPTEHADGLGRLVVLGVRAGLTDLESARRLKDALDAHHFTDGLAVVPPGTPSNTTASGGGYTRADPDGTRGYASERGAPLVAADDGSDGSLIAAALGLDAAVVVHVVGADGRSSARAAAMRTALWGIAEGTLRSTLAAAAGADAVRDHLAAAGPLPALRVGFQPYGIVPVTSLQRWAAEPGEAPEALVAALRDVLATWRIAAGRIPRAVPGMPLDALLAEHAHSVRLVVPGADGAPSLVIEPGVGPLTVDYVALLRDADRTTIENESFPEWPDARSGPRPHPLLYLLLRAAVLAGGDDRVATALDALAGATADALRVALLEALDTASHRVDPYVTALATTRMRSLAPGAVRLGAYGWLENLTPAPPPTPVAVERGRPPLVERSDNHGHLLAPSLAHATSAAVLRSGYVSHRDDPGSALAIDLSSRRVGIADWIIRGVRNGQPLAALLGYRFERLVADAGLQRYLHPLRTLAGLRGEDELERARAAVPPIERETLRLQEELETLSSALTSAQQALSAAVKARMDVVGRRDAFDSEKAQLDALVAAATAADEALQVANRRLAEHQAARPRPVIVVTGELDNRGKPIKDIEPVDTAVLELWQEENERRRVAQQQAAETARTARTAADASAPRRGELAALIAALNDPANPNGVAAVIAAEQAKTRITTQAARAVAEKEGEVRDAEGRLAAARQAFAKLLQAQWAIALESVAAANVVDGLELHRRYRAGRAENRWDATTIPFGDASLGFGGDASTALGPALADLADAVDAVADLVVAESVHQMVLGNPLRSGATLDAVATGEVPPPELDVIRTPRRGIGVTHRVIALFDDATAPAWGAAAISARAAAEPQLNA